MSIKDYWREREQEIIQIIGKSEMTTREIAEILETDTGSAGSYLSLMEKKGFLISTSKISNRDGKLRKRLFWQVK